MDAIYKEKNNDIEQCLTEMLKRRLATATALRWSHLINALRQNHVNLAGLANDLAKAHDHSMVQLSTCNEAHQSHRRNPRAIHIEGKVNNIVSTSGKFHCSLILLV